MCAAICMVNGGQSHMLNGTDGDAISQRVVEYVKDLLAVSGCTSTYILSEAVLREHKGVYLTTSKFMNQELLVLGDDVLFFADGRVNAPFVGLRVNILKSDHVPVKEEQQEGSGRSACAKYTPFTVVSSHSSILTFIDCFYVQRTGLFICDDSPKRKPLQHTLYR